MADPSYRRFLVSAIKTTRFEGMPGVSAVLIHMHDAQPGTPLPSTFPARAKLVAAHYTCLEDLAGADLDELVYGAGLSSYEASIVLGALT